MLTRGTGSACLIQQPARIRRALDRFGWAGSVSLIR